MGSKKTSSVRRQLKFFTYAFAGVRFALIHHKSFLIQSFIGIVVILGGFWFNLSQVEWLFLVITIFVVLAAELLNTAIETTLDYMAKEHHMDVMVAKDVAAGGVLLVSICAVVVGLIIFVPHVFNL